MSSCSTRGSTCSNSSNDSVTLDHGDDDRVILVDQDEGLLPLPPPQTLPPLPPITDTVASNNDDDDDNKRLSLLRLPLMMLTEIVSYLNVKSIVTLDTSVCSSKERSRVLLKVLEQVVEPFQSYQHNYQSLLWIKSRRIPIKR